MKKPLLYFSTLFIGIALLYACNVYYFRSNYRDANSLLHDTQNMQTKLFLKAHLKNGDVCILRDTWQIDTVNNTVTGSGIRYDFNRSQADSGKMTIATDSVAIFETNKKIIQPESGRIAALSILAGIDVAIGTICLTNPKACFGSCPTFYVNEKSNFHYSDAEGFSNAISPSMEYYDIDALNNQAISAGQFSITMKNEALETHCVNDVKLYAWPRNNGERVYQSPTNNFYVCENNYKLSNAVGDEGDIKPLLQSDDKNERFSLSDENNLSSKEAIYLDYDNVTHPEDLGLIVSFRQTLMTTFFIYSAIGYMGNEVGDIFAKVETNKETNNQLKNGIKKELGNIDVYSWNESTNNWEFQGGFYETGPIAINRQILRFKSKVESSHVKLKIVLNKGLWRLDYLALTNIKNEVHPIEISPSTILNKGKIDNAALASINGPDKYLISMPGSEYKFNFDLPKKNTDYELFLYSKGYYIEWMREHWLKDKDLLKLRQMVYNSKKYLKSEAKYYKQYEATMEQEFWNSKIDTKTFSYHEN